MKIIVLDIDGVLNTLAIDGDVSQEADETCVRNFNRVLHAHTDAKIVISSPWRILVNTGMMTLPHFEQMLINKGIHCRDRVIDVLDKPFATTPETPLGHDPENPYGLRRVLIGRCLSKHDYQGHVVIDDAPIGWVENRFVKTDSKIGFTEADAERAIGILNQPSDW